MRKMKLSEIVEVKSGCPNVPPAEGSRETAEYKSVAIKDLVPNTIFLNSDVVETKRVADIGLIEKHILSPGDILITAKGTSLRSGVFRDSAIPVVPTTNLFVIKVRTRDILPEYLSIFLNLAPTVEKLKSRLSGTTVVAITRKDLLEFEVSAPELNVQKQLVELYEAAKEFAQFRTEEIKNNEELLNAALMQQIFGRGA